MASDTMALEEFPDSAAITVSDDPSDKTAHDLTPVFDVPVNISAVLGKAGGGLYDEHHVDAMGSLICTRRATASRKGRTGKPTRILLAAHMDEIGFYVRHVDDKGFLWLNAAGGFDTRNLFSNRVTVVTERGDLKGVMNPGGKPIHISSEAERTKVPGVEEFCVDLGMDAAEVRRAGQVHRQHHHGQGRRPRGHAARPGPGLPWRCHLI